jgi:hypothetical protein
MTPAERAQQIDREEFAAECAAIRQRAYALLSGEPVRTATIESWIKRREPKGSIKARRSGVDSAARSRATKAKHYTALGQTRTLKEWAIATGMSRNTIRNRLDIGWTIEDAVTRPVQARSNFKENSNGTA